MEPGDTFLLRRQRTRLWVTLTPEDRARRAYGVNFEPWRHPCDETVLVTGDKHVELLDEELYSIPYGDTRLLPIGTLLTLPQLRLTSPCSPALLRSIQEGALKSERTPADALAAIAAELRRSRAA